VCVCRRRLPPLLEMNTALVQSRKSLLQCQDCLPCTKCERVRGNLQRAADRLLIRRHQEDMANGHEHSGRILYKRAVKSRALLPGRPAKRLARRGVPACAHVQVAHMDVSSRGAGKQAL